MRDFGKPRRCSNAVHLVLKCAILNRGGVKGSALFVLKCAIPEDLGDVMTPCTSF